MGIGYLKEKANKYIDDSAGEATKEALADLQAKYESLMAQMDVQPIEEAPKAKRTRRTKAEMEAVKLDEAV